MKEIILQNDYIENVAHDQLVVKCAVGTAERGGAVKILCQTAEVKITAVEALEKSASVSGKVTYKLLYLDRENTPQGLDYFCEFSERIQDERIAADMHIIAEASVVDLSASLSGEEFHLSAVVL